MSDNYICKCECHTPGFTALIHCFDDGCCQGRCPACGNYVTYKEGHYQTCDKLETWKKTQKRKVLKQLGLIK